MMTGTELLTIRKNELGLTQTGLANALGVNLSTVWRWEKGQLPISGVVTKAIEKLVEDARKAREAA